MNGWNLDFYMWPDWTLNWAEWLCSIHTTLHAHCDRKWGHTQSAALSDYI